MNVDLKKNFPLAQSTEQAWTLLSNIESVAACMPGAEITEVVDENNFKGTVKVKLGPVTMSFNGDINVKSIDPEKQQVHLLAEGSDSKRTSTAEMDLVANIELGEDGKSALIGDATVIVNGKLASFGARMMSQVSDQILEQFADNFRDKLAESATAAASNDGEALKNTETADQEVPAASPAKSKGNEINGFKFAWNALIGFITSFFRSNKSQ